MWASGIQDNFKLEAFTQAWNYIHVEATSHRLEYLSYFIENKTDPKLTDITNIKQNK